MESIRVNYLIVASGCLFFAVLLAPLNVHGATLIGRDDFSYSKNHSKGPQHWGGLCTRGNFQSPIALHEEKVKILPAERLQLKRAYKPASAVLRNRGHDIQVAWKGDAGGIIINGTFYKLLQAHWHIPGEHTIDGKTYDMELHLVHKSSQGALAAVGILYSLGRPDSFIAKLMSKIQVIKDEAIKVGKLNPWGIVFGTNKFFRYNGSLTVPPCTEGVLWTVLKSVKTVSADQICALKKAVHSGFEENARPTQESDGRTVSVSSIGSMA